VVDHPERRGQRPDGDDQNQQPGHPRVERTPGGSGRGQEHARQDDGGDTDGDAPDEEVEVRRPGDERDGEYRDRDQQQEELGQEGIVDPLSSTGDPPRRTGQ